jgi:hypothetical protein
MTAQTVPGPRPSAVLAARYARALDIAVVVAAAGWQLAGAGPLLLAHLASYSSAPGPHRSGHRRPCQRNLAGARHCTGTVDGVIVSLVSDSPARPALPASPAGLVVDSQRDQQSLWVEARWNTT